MIHYGVSSAEIQPTGETDTLPPFTLWDSDGFIPPIGSSDSTSSNRSPYYVSMYELVEDFGHTQARQRLLNGFLDYRAELREAGLVRGFQWVNGSFLEDVETREMRDPDDIDVVTFFHLPDGHNEETLYHAHQSIFDQSATKSKYAVDSHYVCLNTERMEYIINGSTYWYSLWSHTREGRWKGYLRIDLAGDDDESARDKLGESVNKGGQP